ncbi:MAG TPA: DNA-processing protein DprA [Beijerinckiaceae bacterium]|jgi:DNA processing protein
MTRLTDAERLDWLRLTRSEGVGPRTFRALLARCGSAAAALDALPALARRTVRVATRAEVERELAAARRHGARIVASIEPDYPESLRAIDSSPPLIAVRGAVEILARPMVAVVGSRNASAAGLTFTERLSRGLGEAGYVVVSGLARGIDTRAHRAALATGTVAVIAGGHDKLYPAENAGLVDAMLDAGGAVVTEMPFGWEPRAQDFPRRNRIVSGLSLGVVVIEAARRSGSLITARLALEQGREVFAVPGSPLDPRAEGTNDLIRQGATLCAEAEHVTTVLDPLVGTPLPHARPRGAFAEPLWDGSEDLDLSTGADETGDRPQAGEGEPQDRLLTLLGPSPIAVDDLVRHSGLPARSVQTALLELELSGRLTRHADNAVSLVR